MTRRTPPARIAAPRRALVAGAAAAAAGALVHRVRTFLTRLDQTWEAARRAALATTGEAERAVLHCRMEGALDTEAYLTIRCRE